ncbi:recombinase [Pseudoclavibacter sp. RFBI5]|uniref:recombinase family protein n=1 Tax=Pseudoclavibacter sp. RFBI5 TaxID=2080578 RepID=UPI000CE8F502|nr:recombinase family protein [Pseudoclavibacter sp. RFBI5]PPG05322.1 recombinase [Pseudoclavibacter sp. RFBI5]
MNFSTPLHAIRSTYPDLHGWQARGQRMPPDEPEQNSELARDDSYFRWHRISEVAAVRSGGELVVTKLDRLARSTRDASAIADELLAKGVALNIGGSIHDPSDPMGKLLFNVLAMDAEFEADLIRMRTREGVKVAKAKGKLRGRKPKLSPTQEKHLVELCQQGALTTAELCAEFSIGRATLYRAIDRAKTARLEARA